MKLGFRLPSLVMVLLTAFVGGCSSGGSAEANKAAQSIGFDDAKSAERIDQLISVAAPQSVISEEDWRFLEKCAAATSPIPAAGAVTVIEKLERRDQVQRALPIAQQIAKSHPDTYGLADLVPKWASLGFQTESNELRRLIPPKPSS